jgi:hypothetical protein
MRGLLVVLLAGCLSGGMADFVLEPTARPDRTPSASEYAFIWVHGSETWEQQGNERALAVCDVAFDHSVDERGRRITYLAEEYEFDRQKLPFLVAFDVWERPSDCPVAYELSTDPNMTRKIGRYGELQLSIGKSVTANGKTIPPGQRGAFDYHTFVNEHGATYEVTGTFYVEPMGPWPRSGLVAQ